MQRTDLAWEKNGEKGCSKVIKVLDGRRTQAAQAAIPGANTRARGLQSLHVWGLAYDIGVFGCSFGATSPEACRQYLDEDPLYNEGIVPETAKSIGLIWGGDWKSFKDYPHYEYPINWLPLTEGEQRLIGRERLTPSRTAELVKLYNAAKGRDPLIYIETRWGGATPARPPLPPWPAK
jgi:hypothetical protein